ncbi:MAG TPA: PIG-L family deacetylase [Flavisolibacter sp.]|nr:PIG-L family deacetylase [Flavisolibacter sp.]
MKKCYFFIITLFLFTLSKAQTSYTSAEIYLGLKKLNVLGSVLYIAAHPDDENTRLLTYFSKDRLYRTGYLSLTRGDGGQNLIGDEQGIALGLIRTQELLSARRIDGAEQFFTRAYDFGYSKTPEETFAKWDKEKILSDVVWVIRKFQPDVIITRFPTTGEGGHGHHTGSAILANEAFMAAADSLRFPEQLKFVRTWKPKRILWNSFNFSNNAPPAGAFKLDVGAFNPVLGKSYGELAAQSRSQHKSQGFGVAASRGEAFEYFKTSGGPEPVNDLFDDITTSWEKIKGSEEVQKQVSVIINEFDFLQPQKSVPQLVQLHKTLKTLPDGYWKTIKLKEVEKLLEAATGLWMEAFSSLPNAVQGDSLKLNFVVNNRLGTPVQLLNIVVDEVDSSLHKNLAANQNLNFSKTIFVNINKPLSQPYWLKEKMQEGLFQVNDQQMIGQPDITPSYLARFSFQIDGERFEFEKPVRYKFTDPVKGEVYQPLFVIPAMTVYASPDVVLFQKGKTQLKEIELFIGANKKINAEQLEARVRSKYYALTEKQTTIALAKNTSRQFAFDLSNDKMSVNEEDYLQPFADFKENGKEHYAYLAMTSINYDHIPAIRYFYSDGIKLLNIDLKTYNKKIGYILGAGDKVPEALEQMGYDVTLLTEKELSRNNLQQFDAIISGVRAYNTNEWLNNYYEKLMKYVENGGNLIVQYNTSSNLGPVKAKIGPYNFTISRTRVTDENSEVQFINPRHPVLNFPNKITQKDFEGWIQERSIYHASDIDTAFQPVLRMNDTGEKADDGSLITAQFGKGYFTYTGLVFFRQLPAGVPGAYRLLANLIALNRKREF